MSLLGRSSFVMLALGLILISGGCHWIASYDPAAAPLPDAQVHDTQVHDAQVHDAQSSDATATVSIPWAQALGGPGLVQSPLVAVDPSGKIIVALTFEGTIDAGDGELVKSLGQTDILLVAYDQNGTLSWKKRFGDLARQQAKALGTSEDGTIVLAGNIRGDV
ncbi:MAG: hypothetical protein JRH20_30065, partial [Deltaproteobacteria bacterium]|nr:hypothetical protein [Deltaproteobacteria bacterium]